MNIKFTVSQIQLLYKLYKMAENYVESNRVDNYDTFDCNNFYYIKEKLGLYDLFRKFDDYNYAPCDEAVEKDFTDWLEDK